MTGQVAKRTVQVGQRVAAGAPLMSIIPLEQVWVEANFKEVQLRQHAHRPAGQAEGGPVRQQGRVPTAASPASAPAPARPSRCCRRRTPPATGSRWCSACRCASSSTRSSWPSIRCASACRWRRRSTSRRRTARRCSVPRRRAAAARPQAFEPQRAQADKLVQRDHRRQPRPRGHARPGACRVRRKDRGDREDTHVSSPAAHCRRSTARHLLRQPAPPARVAFPPLRGQRARAGHAGAVAGHVHERARLVDRQRLDPGHRRRHGREPGAGHLGHHLVRAWPTPSPCR